MIDLCSETLIPIREAPRHLPKRLNGKRIHISACYRWISRGVRGVRLDSIKIGGSTYTSIEALQRFANRLSGSGNASRPRVEVSPARQQEIDFASEQLKSQLASHLSRKLSEG